MNNDISRVLFTEGEIRDRVCALGKEIAEDYRERELFILGVLKGSFIFMADLVRSVELPLSLNFIAASSYGDAAESSGVVKITRDLKRDVTGLDVILVEDIVDTGVTLFELKKYLAGRGAASVKIAALLDKPSRRKVEVIPDYCGFSVPDEFVVGYGLDYAEKYRNLPYIGILKPEIYQK